VEAVCEVEDERRRDDDHDDDLAAHGRVPLASRSS
jgi:hypothetical protein